MSHVGAGNATMSAPPYLSRMDDPATLKALAAQDAAEALIAIGWPVEPDDNFKRWRLGDFLLTDDELMSLAARHGFVPVSDRVQ